MNEGIPHRTEYTKGTLRREDLDADPVHQFGQWLADAEKHHTGDPSAVALATATPDGKPSARMVLLKSFGPAGFVFATRYAGRKGRELIDNPHAALLFFWEDQERQIRIEGRVEKSIPAVSDEVFDARPVASRIAAVTSSQSQPISSREALDALYEANVARYAENPPTRPETWGAFTLKPTVVEFWQGGKNRLHDRFEYRLESTGWVIRRLQP